MAVYSPPLCPVFSAWLSPLCPPRSAGSGRGCRRCWTPPCWSEPPAPGCQCPPSPPGLWESPQVCSSLWCRPEIVPDVADPYQAATRLTCKLSRDWSGLVMLKILWLMTSISLRLPRSTSPVSSWPLDLASMNKSLTLAFLNNQRDYFWLQSNHEARNQFLLIVVTDQVTYLLGYKTNSFSSPLGGSCIQEHLNCRLFSNSLMGMVSLW